MKRYFRNPVSKFRSQKRARCVNLAKRSEAVEGREIFQQVKNQCNVDGKQVSISDRQYALLDEKVLKKALRRDGTDKFTYTKEGGDCDDFAQILCGRVKEYAMLCDFKAGAAFGVCAGELWAVGQKDGGMVKHAMNIVVTAERQVFLVEPQTDKWYRPDPRNVYWYIII